MNKNFLKNVDEMLIKSARKEFLFAKFVLYFSIFLLIIIAVELIYLYIIFESTGILPYILLPLTLLICGYFVYLINKVNKKYHEFRYGYIK